MDNCSLLWQLIQHATITVLKGHDFPLGHKPVKQLLVLLTVIVTGQPLPADIT